MDHPGQVSFRPPTIKFTDVACGDHFSAAVSTSGDLYTWGRQDFLQLGYSLDANEEKKKSQKKTKGASSSLSPRLGKGGAPFPRPILGDLRGSVVSVSVGTDHVCAVVQSGQLYTWGRGAFSQLGLGDSKDRLLPCAVPGLPGSVASVSAGWRFTVCALDDGSVYSWGAGSAGQLGHQSKLRRRVPTKIEAFEKLRGEGEGRVVVFVTCGETHAMALTEDGKMFAWGSNEDGRLGLPDLEARTMPSEVRLPQQKKDIWIRSIDAGHRHTACIDSGGRVYTWGYGGSGRLGHGTTDSCHVPTLVESRLLTRHHVVTSVHCGHMHTCAVVNSGTSGRGGGRGGGRGERGESGESGGALYSWGCGNGGRLGQGPNGSKHEDKLRPTIVHMEEGSSSSSSASSFFVRVASGSNHNLALDSRGRLSSWGALGSVSNKGQLGPSENDCYPDEMEAPGAGSGDAAVATSMNDFDAFDAGTDDSDSSGVELEEDEEYIHGMALARTSSSLMMRVKAHHPTRSLPTITDHTLLSAGGADPHPALTTPSMMVAGHQGPRIQGPGSQSPGSFTPRPGGGGDGSGHRQVAAFPEEFEGTTNVTTLGEIKVYTPTSSAQKKQQQRAKRAREAALANSSPTLLSLAEPNSNDEEEPEEMRMMEGEEEEDENEDDLGDLGDLGDLREQHFNTSNVFVVDSSSDGHGHATPPNRQKLEAALNKTMKNFTDYKFLTMIRSMIVSLRKQHFTIKSRALCQWRMSTRYDDLRVGAMDAIRDVKLGYDMYGSRMMYRMYIRLGRRLLQRGMRSFTYNMLVGRATGRALDSTSDARNFLEERVIKLKSVEKTMRQRLQYHRNVMRDRLRKTTIRYGRDKLYHVFRLHQEHSLRSAFSTWCLRAQVTEQMDLLRRGRLKLQVGRDQLLLKKDRISSLEHGLLSRQRKVDIFFAFHKWLSLKQFKEHEEQLNVLKKEKEYMIEELQIIDSRMKELNSSSEEAETVKRQRGGLVIHALDNFSDTLAHEVVKMRSI